MPGNCPHYGRWPQHGFTSLKKLRPQSVTSRIQPGSDVIVCAEMDEQWGYVGAKSRQRWLFYAYDRIRRTVVAHVFGERTLATLARLLSLLSAFEVVVWMTDGWPLYESRLKGKLHVISKRYTQRIERHNLNLRQEVWTPVCMEPTLKYHPLMFDVLTLTRNPGCGQCLVGSLTGAVCFFSAARGVHNTLSRYRVKHLFLLSLPEFSGEPR